MQAATRPHRATCKRTRRGVDTVGKNRVIDPFTYIGRVHRDDNGKITSMEVFSHADVITLADGDEFITFTTVVDLDAPAPKD